MSDAQDSQRSQKPKQKEHLVTCSVSSLQDRLCFLTQSPIVLVLDRKSLEGHIMGVLQEGDVACATVLELPWVMIPEGSFVRHPKMRQGRIKLQRRGWLMSKHPQYGELLAGISDDQVRKLFEEEAFAKLPMVKVGGSVPQSRSTEPEAMPAGYPSVPSQLPQRRAPAAVPPAEAGEAAVKAPPAKEAALAPEQAGTASETSSEAQQVVGEERSRSAAWQGRSEASLTSSVPRRPWAVAPRSSPPSPVTSFASPVSEQLPEEASPSSSSSRPSAVKTSSRGARRPSNSSSVHAPPESCERHLQTCNCEHWKVLNAFVFVRAEPSTDGEPVAVAREDSIICIARTAVEERRSPDGKWIRLGREAKVWNSLASDKPDFMTAGREEMFMLIHKPGMGDLLRLVPSQRWTLPPEAPTQEPVEFSKSPSGRSRAESAGSAIEVLDLSRLDHWVVVSSGCRISSSRDTLSADDLILQEGDQVRAGDHSMSRIFRETSVRWLTLPMGAQVYRGSDTLFGPGGFSGKSSYVRIEDAERTYLRKHSAVETGTNITVLSAYGEPWVVEHDQVVVRRGPSTADMPLGIMLKGDVVGVRQRKGDWVELTQDSDVRFKQRAGGDQPICAINWMRRHKAPHGSSQEQQVELLAATPLKAWMLVERSDLGQLLRRARKRKGGLSGCVLAEERRRMYLEVIELCHRRIYKENLEALWDGEADKLPTQESLEGKLFDADTSVIHITNAGRLAGGALVKEISVKAKQVEGSSNLSLGSPHAGTSPELHGHTTVGYIDMCASEPGTGGGRALWDFVCGMKFVCVACHSILLQKTVDFWQARGMKHMDPSSEKDCDAFRKLVMVHTMGKVVCELSDLQEALPKSKLPLFVWVPSRFTEVDAELHDSHIFRPTLED
eukprot:TRINITY_DN37679_c0_g1_i2.p1 TRINITY_DN37679_c0_g1~~TRINITY_DN37679_c0_g1_i2.p1  ORF type:complete len:895 (+),score=165.17 TRINITY_DN37679_c0_g1_i2:47-2731(+)